MEISLSNIAFNASVWDVKRAVGKVLHSEEFFNPTDSKDRPANFMVTLKRGRGGVENNGTGTMTVGSRKIGDKFLKWIRAEGNFISINDSKICFYRSHNMCKRRKIQKLEKVPYVSPDVEEEKEEILRKFDVSLHVDKIQFGVFYQLPGSSSTASRAFSCEFEISHKNKGAGLLRFEYDRKLIHIQMGDTMTEETAHDIAITFVNIRELTVGLDFGNPFICFDILTPPILEKQRINRELTGDDWRDNRKFRQRLSSLTATHAVVAPYAHQLRVILNEEQGVDCFEELCKVAGLQRPVRAKVEAYNCGFFLPKKLHNIKVWVRSFDWPVAFQLEALLHNGLLTTEDLLGVLRGPVVDLYDKQRVQAGEVLRLYSAELRSRKSEETPMQCFNRIRNEDVESTPLLPGNFACHHITFTPTRMILEGPYVIQSNRVIRRYADHQEHFIRVDFRDEDRLQYRWAREVDGLSLLEERVGGVLKNGFELAGREFEFLAYSSSALREHSVWFMNPFHHPTEGYVTSQRIRDSLGDFSGVIRQPSKYAARIAQAFTATDPSVSITKDHWEEMDDLGHGDYLFTDGVGTISVQLGDMIWEALCNARPESRQRCIKPSAVSYKGMVVIDARLDGVKMRLRPSMNKFKAHNEDLAEIEIARAFERPGKCYLNRPLVMILEDRGVDKKTFLKLQETAKTAVYTATDSIANAIDFLRDHQLGAAFRLPYILESLEKLGMGFGIEGPERTIDDPFIDRLIQYSKNHVLRDIRHGARILIPDSYKLVGVADEGPAYQQEGVENVFCLSPGQIYACIQDRDDEAPRYLKGAVIIERSPVVHPGDVQRVTAIGEPPADKVCFFRNLKNVVVLPSVGDRSLASCLGGGDLDGDLYSVIKYGALLPPEHEKPAEYPPGEKNELDRDSTIEDICDFVVEYFNSDVLGLLSDRHLVIAGNSYIFQNGTRDKKCLKLAQLCSQAVDYPKNGVPAEDVNPLHTEFYNSTRALGELYRNIRIVDPTASSQAGPATNGGSSKVKPLSDAISVALKPSIEHQLHHSRNEDRYVADMSKLFQKYADELRYICMTHTLSDAPDVRLVEEEVVVGTIMAKCSQKRWRQDRIQRMHLHSSTLVEHIKLQLFNPTQPYSHSDLTYALSQAWLAWDFSSRNKTVFGANSFGLIALEVVFDILDKLTVTRP
ncbi:RdRP-domain-containing protein [Laetiporus sulphureus 93-53]|uniref:RNA-dependent RNA polymerase n=1 Tax=Laetiporus sulphureus 93-53 TaxID=1314785 RepID=A0A165EG61_9APHY|nr:RdRP-domain-containing protein [Laetiporus sulphureus 93-53]KZT06990.1 RdRP-domain-containing protein [Laetiporus sulphureus 93-53]